MARPNTEAPDLHPALTTMNSPRCPPLALLHQANRLSKRKFATQSPNEYIKKSLLRALKREAAIDVRNEVRDALASHRPIVALESALITNGISSPTNLEIARSLEATVRRHGAVPATIGIVDGRVKIGMQDEDLQRLADTGHNKAVKVSRRDIGAVIAQRMDGGTTISATTVLASIAGIKVCSPSFSF